MRRARHVATLTLSFLLGVAVGVAAVAVHRSGSGAVIGMVTTLAVMWAMRSWLPPAVVTFAAGWLTTVLVAVSGRGEGDYVVSSDARGWWLIGFGLVVLVTGLLWGRTPRGRSDSGSLGKPT
jgi:hypothetical protein